MDWHGQTGVVAMDATSSPSPGGGPAPGSFMASGFEVPGSDAVDGVWTSGLHIPRWVANTGLIGMVLVVASGMFVHAARGMLFTPEDAVADFFTGLAVRDIGTAGANGIRTDLITGDGYAPPANPVVETMRRLDDDRAVAVVGFDLAGTRSRTEVSVTRTRFWGPWTVAAPSSSVDITWPHDAEELVAAIDGTALLPGQKLLPGVYTVGTAAHDAYESAGEVPLVVSASDTDVAVAPPIRPRADLVPRLSALVNTYLDTCAANADDEATFVPGCPLRLTVGLPWPENISWRIDSYPVVSLVIGDLRPLEVATTTPGQATATFEQDGDGKSRSIEVKAVGWIELDDGRMVWHRDNLASTSE